MKLKYILQSGDRFGKLTVIEQGQCGNHRERRFICKCDCGHEALVRVNSLVTSNVVSCGCWRSERARGMCQSKATHGETRGGRATPEYNTIKNIFQRCRNPNNSEFHNYGGRGIDVYGAWSDYAVFVQYLKSTIGRRPTPQHSIDRINNDRNYEPGNIRWVLPSVQIANRRKMAVLSAFSSQELMDELKKRGET